MLRDALTTLIQAAAGGTLVVCFALLGETTKPKHLAGIFAAAPSIAIAGLVVTVVAKGDDPAARAALGMMFGAAGFVVFSVCVRRLLPRVSALAASAAAVVAWSCVAVGSYLVAFR